MPRVLLISSYTADSHVGGQTSAFVLRRLGVDVTWLPTTLFGRHPGWGDPGGTATDISILRKMWGAIQDQIREQGRYFDAVMSGYLGDHDHVGLVVEIIDHLKPKTVLIDPVMGDGKLYIDEKRAEAICDHLVPRAHICTPNLWEWRYITGALRDHPPRPPSPLTGVRETVVTSVPSADEDSEADRIGARLFHQTLTGQTIAGQALAGQTLAYEIAHARFQTVPNGGGDALAAAYLAHRLKDRSPDDALARSVSAVFTMMQAANATEVGELPFIRAQDALCAAPTLPIRSLSLDQGPSS